MIQFDYSKAMAQARDLDRLAGELTTLANRTLTPGHSDLRCAWRGDSADLFLRKSNNVIKDITRTAKTMTAIATAVRLTAKTLKAADDAANRLWGGK